MKNERKHFGNVSLTRKVLYIEIEILITYIHIKITYICQFKKHYIMQRSPVSEFKAKMMAATASFNIEIISGGF